MLLMSKKGVESIYFCAIRLSVCMSLSLYLSIPIRLSVGLSVSLSVCLCLLYMYVGEMERSLIARFNENRSSTNSEVAKHIHTNGSHSSQSRPPSDVAYCYFRRYCMHVGENEKADNEFV